MKRLDRTRTEDTVLLVLWDIDHTLIATRGVGRELSALAFERTTGQPMREQASIDGITEPVIFRETAELHGLHTSREDFNRFADALTAAHLQHGGALRERGHALPGAAAAVDALSRQPDVRQTVLTGNVRRVAEIKLATFGLDQHIDWELGAYGDDADERADLVQLVLVRSSLTPQEAVVIGDTPADVRAGHAAGVRVIAVATGRSSGEELHQAGADRVLPSLVDTHALLRALLTDR